MVGSAARWGCGRLNPSPNPNPKPNPNRDPNPNAKPKPSPSPSTNQVGLWSAEASLMSLGRHEEHRTLALRPAAARGACLHCVRAGQYEVRVLQCVGHFLHELAEGRPSDGVLRSDYPLLLLHAQVGVRRLPSPYGAEDSAHEAGEPPLSERARRAAEAKQLGSDLESLLGLS